MPLLGELFPVTFPPITMSWKHKQPITVTILKVRAQTLVCVVSAGIFVPKVVLYTRLFLYPVTASAF